MWCGCVVPGCDAGCGVGVWCLGVVRLVPQDHSGGSDLFMQLHDPVEKQQQLFQVVRVII